MGGMIVVEVKAHGGHLSHCMKKKSCCPMRWSDHGKLQEMERK
jgi:hypothetical protein